ncbi:MAG: fibronectin type III domain-containing protein, partial [Spirochaetes bacterium]|nr:fibronectin type III domain-containing protein [Spirochaetota bacterium]
MIRYKNLNYYFVLIVLILFQVNSLTAQIIMSPWGTNEKRVTGNFLPIHNIYPYTLMTNQGTGQWQYSCYYIPGQKVTIKFIVNTNTLSPKYIFELMDPRQIEITFGTQGTIYVTNTPAGLMRVTEGTGINGYMSIEFNWEDDPDPPTGISAQVDAREAEIRWSRSLEMDVIGYNVYLSNNFYPYYKKMNRIFITNNRFTVTNLITGSTNYVFITSVDAYTNMPNFESERSSVIQFIADKVINVLFYLQKRREDVSGDLYLGGSVSPLDWTPTQTMTYLYNDNWYFSTVIMKGTSLEYKYNIGQNSSKWEDDLPTSSGNRELVISDSDNDGVMVINDVWGTETVINPPPQAPTNFMAVPGNTNVMLLWRKNREIDLAGYRVYRSMKNTNNFSLIAELLNTNYRDSGLWNNTNYYYRLTATDHEKNESGYSRVILAVPSTNAPPVIPTGLNAAAGDSEVTLRWAQNPEGDIQGYLIWRSEDKYSLYTNISPLLSNTVFTDIFVNNNMTYYYKMQAVDTVGQTNQGYSQIVKAVPSTNTTPSVVTGLELSVTGNRSITIKFNPNSETDIAGYNIYYKKENGVQGGPVSSVSPSYTIINSLENGARYSVWVTALDTLGQEGEASEKITATPVPRITDLLTKPSGTETGAVLLGWTSPEKAGDLGSAKRYIVKYSSAPISFFSEFWEADLFCDTFANGAATLESLKVNNLGTGSPGYYFTIGAIYGLDQGIGLSSSVYQNASQSVNHSSGGTFRKKGERVRIDIPPYTIGEEATAVVIRNYSDISKLNDPVLNEKISTANDKVNNH